VIRPRRWPADAFGDVYPVLEHDNPTLDSKIPDSARFLTSVDDQAARTFKMASLIGEQRRSLLPRRVAHRPRVQHTMHVHHVWAPMAPSPSGSGHGRQLPNAVLVQNVRLRRL